MLPTPPSGTAYILAGPTASGKTEVAHRLACRAGWDILSADSMLVYRGMTIGTAKPEPHLQREVRYWGLDRVDPGMPFSLARFMDEARAAVAANAERDRGVVVVGGTGLYVKALLEGLDAGPPPDPEARARWEKRMAEEGVESVQAVLEKRHPDLWSTMNASDRSNPRRLIRAFELGAAGVASVKRSWSGGTKPAIAALSWPPEALRTRIVERVARMYAEGFFDEVRALLDRGFERALATGPAIGYAEAVACLQGRLREAEARAETVRRTWQLARRQMTWLRHQARVRWVDLDGTEAPDTVTARVAQAWRETGAAPLRVRPEGNRT